jgi:hypothetical protein
MPQKRTENVGRRISVQHVPGQIQLRPPVTRLQAFGKKPERKLLHGTSRTKPTRGVKPGVSLPPIALAVLLVRIVLQQAEMKIHRVLKTTGGSLAIIWTSIMKML